MWGAKDEEGIMSRALLPEVNRFTERIDHCVSTDAVIEELRMLGAPQARLLGIWRIPLSARRGSRAPYPNSLYPARDLPTKFQEEYWKLFSQHGPSFIARYIWQTRRDATLSEAIRIMKPA